MTILHSGAHLDLVEREGWEFVARRCSGVVAVVALTEAGEVVLIEQYREPVRARVIELPAGLVGDEGNSGEDAAIAARRELVEETGFDCTAIRHVGRGPSSAGLTSEIVEFFLATGVRRVEAGGGVGGEEIAVHLVPLPEVRTWLAARETEGCLVDPKIVAGLFFSGKR